MRSDGQYCTIKGLDVAALSRSLDMVPAGEFSGCLFRAKGLPVKNTKHNHKATYMMIFYRVLAPAREGFPIS